MLQNQGTTATWVSTSSFISGAANLAYNIAGGAANQIPYQTATSATVFSSNLTFNGTALTVGGAVTAAQFIPNNATVPTNGLYGASNSVGIATNSVNRMFFNNSGLIGVGNNTTPSSTMDINGTFRVTGLSTFTNTTEATTAGIAAVDIEGGLYVAKKIIAGQATNATSTITGALLIPNGGAGINGDVWAKKIYSDSIDVVANAVIMATAFG